MGGFFYKDISSFVLWRCCCCVRWYLAFFSFFSFLFFWPSFMLEYFNSILFHHHFQNNCPVSPTSIFSLCNHVNSHSDVDNLGPVNHKQKMSHANYAVFLHLAAKTIFLEDLFRASLCLPPSPNPFFPSLPLTPSLTPSLPPKPPKPLSPLLCMAYDKR